MNTNPPAAGPAIDPQNPWLGLASFTEETRAYFHGRDDEIGELSRRVQRKLLTILFGQSGLGKTSILRAGIVPRLRPEGYCPVYVRLDYGRESPPPAEQIKQAILRTTAATGQWSQPGVSQAGETLWEFLHHRDDVLRDAAGRTLIPLLIFDQFEEIFTLAQSDDFGRQRAAQFAEDLADLVENRAPKALEAKLDHDETAMERFDFARADYRILIALREDYLAHLEGLKTRMPSVTQNRMRLARMTGLQALTAVTGPGGTLVNDEVARAIVRFIAGGAELERAEVEPSLLSLVCRELNATRLAQGRAEISADLLAGSRDTILSEFYERTLADQPAGVRAFIEDELLTDSGYRESIAEERAKKGFVAAGAPAESLATLVDRRLLRVEERLDVRRVELTHDVLCGVVRASRDVRQEREARAAEVRRRAETEAQLATARKRESEAQAAALRARFIATACIVLAVGAVGAAVWGYVNQRRAQAAENRVALERDRAQQSRGEAEKLIAFLLDDLSIQLEPTGRIEIAAGLARRALTYFGALPPEFRDARSERYRAIALGRLGAALALEGKTLEAEDPLREAEQLFAKLRAGGDTGLETTVGLAAVLRQQSRNAYLQNRPLPSVEIAQRGTALIAPAAEAADAALASKVEHARALMNLGFILMRDRQNAPAMENLERARQLFHRLMAEPAERQRAAVLYAETCAWTYELGRLMGRADEFRSMVDEALLVATAAVEREAGNLGALRSRALLRNRKTQEALDRYDFVAAEKSARETTADWTEFLRFDSANDTARNNRRVASGLEAQALWRQGRFDEVIEITKQNTREVIAAGGSPSTVRGAAFGVGVVDDLEADLGRVKDVDAAMTDWKRLRELGVAQVDGESYFRFSHPVWNENQRTNLLLRSGRTAEALEASRSNAGRIGGLVPKSGQEKQSHRSLNESNLAVQTEANLALGRWADAARAARELVRGRPTLDDTSEAALDGLARDRALAGLAFARNQETAEARALLDQAETFNRALRAAGANDHASRYQTAMIALGRGLLAGTPAEKKTAFAAGLAEIAAMPAQPRQLRSVRDLRTTLETELARVSS